MPNLKADSFSKAVSVLLPEPHVSNAGRETRHKRQYVHRLKPQT